ncbi:MULTISPECIES: hypothetical protein [Agrobacterium]|uniref:Uncharacterized protein n=1 Tax=Agrobacterium tumefaciens TaxID=358 RepID=A0AAE6B7M0_AGRTU|nr:MULTISPECIES: hypothetical protein [Agrobacterium]QCL72242.1 hypothetical protein CFBP5499_01500 [Agrobacterium tumefaciens]QCL77813.1 hypothetical protein CFBP5877_01050 [Agrobacterium tumefaciens]CUX22445.1 conserved hypothetical protein [Agrobacterium sp. NCPPB 925]
MKTDWNVIRGMMNAAINACERIEASGYVETDRDAMINIGGRQVSVHDMLVSAWTYPENLRYQIIRERHETGGDLPYVPETARILLAISQAAAELVNAGEVTPAQEKVHEMITWLDNHLVPGIENATAARRKT